MLNLYLSYLSKLNSSTCKTLILLLYCLPLVAQDKLEGIGKFKINKTPISITDEIAIETGDKLNVLDGRYNTISDGLTRIGELIPNKTNPDESIAGASYCPNVRVFYINNYKIAGITIQKIYLTFKSGVLIGFESEGSERLDEALNLKYGPPKLTVEKKPVTCLYTQTGNKAQLEQAKYIKRWVNETVSAVERTEKNYDSNCEEVYRSELTIANTLSLREINACDSAIRSKLRAAIQSIKKSQLKDF